MANQVNVLCKLPAGLVLEVGYVMDYALEKFVKTPAYKCAVLKGALKAQVEAIQAVGGDPQFKMPGNFIPAVTAVDEDLAREWFRLHSKDWVVRSGIVAIVEKPADAKPMLKDLESVKTTFEPVDVSAPGADKRIKGIGLIEKADFAKSGW